ncbi:thioesterase II family protein [Streptomyces sp. NPDC058662]|uniref:thioesterase II family protein n=1 Tax=Streptomyces sp. NPDC058662 TaxID=3346583 RepID=UPI003656A105
MTVAATAPAAGTAPARTDGRPGALSVPRPVPGASLRLFLFHHAGGSPLLYRDWEKEFPPDWEVCLLTAPGRGRLRGSPPLGTVDELVAFFHEELGPWLDRPYAFFGHSMGAIVAQELTRLLARRGERGPLWLGLSSCGVPAPPADRPSGGRHLLTDDGLRDWLRQVGGTPLELLDEPAVWRHFAPVFRSDFQLVDTWEPDPGAPPLAVPLTVFGGESDMVVTRHRLAAWAERAPHFRGLYLYGGGHFYLREHQRSLTRRITAAVIAARRAARLPDRG